MFSLRGFPLRVDKIPAPLTELAGDLKPGPSETGPNVKRPPLPTPSPDRIGPGPEPKHAKAKARPGGPGSTPGPARVPQGPGGRAWPCRSRTDSD